MKRAGLIILTVVVLIGAPAGFWWVSRSDATSSKENNTDLRAQQTDGPVAYAKTIPVKEGVITEDIAANGRSVPAPEAVRSVSVPYESRVSRVMVSEGQEVAKGDILLEIEPSPDTLLQLEQAQALYESTKENLYQMQRRFDLRVITNDQLLDAKQALRQADLSLENMKQRGADGKREIRAGVTGLSDKVNVQGGAIVPAGGPLVEIIAQSHFEVRLGVEPEDVGYLQLNQPVTLAHADGSAAPSVTGHIRKVSRSVNPTTRLVDVFVTLPPSADFLLGEYVYGTILIASKQGLVVPRAAVLPEDGKQVLYTVEEGRAVKHTVQTGLENKEELEIAGGGIRAGDLAVILGNYELEDGMIVQAEVPQ